MIFFQCNHKPVLPKRIYLQKSLPPMKFIFDTATLKEEVSIDVPGVLLRKTLLKRKLSCLMSPPPWHCTPASS